MAIIPADEKVFMVDKRTNTTYGGSQALQDMQQWYTMQDVADSVQPYKVFTALLTQSGGSSTNFIGSGELTIGVTYLIDHAIGDFTNVGAPNNDFGTQFIATGTTPASWAGGNLSYDSGAPVATVLENTIGNIWFTYDGVGTYSVRTDGLFLNNKTTLSINLMGDDLGTGYLCLGFIQDTEKLGIATGTENDVQDGVLVWKTPIEIRVYN
jgi:hypothetical protein